MLYYFDDIEQRIVFAGDKGKLKQTSEFVQVFDSQAKTSKNGRPNNICVNGRDKYKYQSNYQTRSRLFVTVYKNSYPNGSGLYTAIFIPYAKGVTQITDLFYNFVDGTFYQQLYTDYACAVNLAVPIPQAPKNLTVSDYYNYSNIWEGIDYTGITMTFYNVTNSEYTGAWSQFNFTGFGYYKNLEIGTGSETVDQVMDCVY
jgi:hypothetical protein